MQAGLVALPTAVSTPGSLLHSLSEPLISVRCQEAQMPRIKVMLDHGLAA
jgi:hypothetical protein